MNETVPVLTDATTDPALSQPKPTESKRHRAVAAVRHALEAADPGTLAKLRRFNAPAAPPVAFYRITVDILDDYLPEAGARRDELEARWAVVVAAMACAQGLLRPVPLGEALFKAEVAENRVLRLLEAQDTQLAVVVRNVVHQLVQKAQPFDPNDLADLVLTDGTERRQESRRRIARSFFRNERT